MFDKINKKSLTTVIKYDIIINNNLYKQKRNPYIFVKLKEIRSRQAERTD